MVMSRLQHEQLGLHGLIVLIRALIIYNESMTQGDVETGISFFKKFEMFSVHWRSDEDGPKVHIEHLTRILSGVGRGEGRLKRIPFGSITSRRPVGFTPGSSREVELEVPMTNRNCLTE